MSVVAQTMAYILVCIHVGAIVLNTALGLGNSINNTNENCVYIPRLDFKSFRSIDVISHLFQIVINFRSLQRFFVVRCTRCSAMHQIVIVLLPSLCGCSSFRVVLLLLLLLLNLFSTFYYAIPNVLLAVSVKVPNQKIRAKCEQMATGKKVEGGKHEINEWETSE